MSKKKIIYLAVLHERPGYCDGSVQIGICDGIDEEEARKNLLDGLPEWQRNKMNKVQLTPMNGGLIEVINIPTDYEG